MNPPGTVSAWPDSARQASELLDAWNRGDLARLRLQLDRTARACKNLPPADEMEVERQDLLVSIVQNIRPFVEHLREHCATQDLQVSLTLLRHLTDVRAA